MYGLPKLPGYNFDDQIKLNYSVSHSLDFKNGYRMPRRPPSGIGGEPLSDDSVAYVAQTTDNDAALYDPILTYGRVKKPPVRPFRPDFVIYDKIVLTFHAFFKQTVPESATEHFRVRYVNIMYFMEDDTITVMEPPILNCGFPQGRIVRRGKIPKPGAANQFYGWKDLNVGIDVAFHGIVYHITDCDEYTKEFMNAAGVEINDVECSPIDPVTTNRIINSNRQTSRTPTNDDKLRRYLEYQGKVLTFNCVLDETDRPFGECISYKMYYFLEDDTVAVKELKENSEGRDYFPMLLKRTKLPKNWKQQPVTYPACSMEITDDDINEFYQPTDFRIGETIFVFGRRFLLLDCDTFTRQYFAEVLKEEQKPKLSIKYLERNAPKRSIPDYLGLGTPEDSMASCYNLNPRPPKKDMIRYLVNANKNLRFGCTLDTPFPEDKYRKFILNYSLSDGLISINEPAVRNSGIMGGKFLSAQLVIKPGSDPKRPEYYTAKDFSINAILIIHCHRFKIVSADLYVYRYMKEHPELFSQEAINGVRNYCLFNGHLQDELRAAMEQECVDFNQKKSEQSINVTDGNQLSDLDQCLKNFKIGDGIAKVQPNATFEDLERNPNYQSSSRNDCPYKVIDPGTIDDFNGDAQDIDGFDDKGQKCDVPASYCNNKSANRKNVHFADCLHKVPTGNCLSCHSII